MCRSCDKIICVDCVVVVVVSRWLEAEASFLFVAGSHSKNGAFCPPLARRIWFLKINKICDACYKYPHMRALTHTHALGMPLNCNYRAGLPYLRVLRGALLAVAHVYNLTIKMQSFIDDRRGEMVIYVCVCVCSQHTYTLTFRTAVPANGICSRIYRTQHTQNNTCITCAQYSLSRPACCMY